MEYLLTKAAEYKKELKKFYSNKFFKKYKNNIYGENYEKSKVTYNVKGVFNEKKNK